LSTSSEHNAVGTSLSFFVGTKLRDATRDVIVIGIWWDMRVRSLTTIGETKKVQVNTPLLRKISTRFFLAALLTDFACKASEAVKIWAKRQKLIVERSF